MSGLCSADRVQLIEDHLLMIITLPNRHRAFLLNGGHKLPAPTIYVNVWHNDDQTTEQTSQEMEGC